jgi:hypothetical protein
MSMDKQKKLANALIARTEQGLLEWKVGLNERSFQVTIGNNTVFVREKQIRGQESSDIVISVLNDEAVEVDSFSDVELNESEEGGHGRQWYTKLKNLFEVARRTALGSDQILNEILSDLGD